MSVPYKYMKKGTDPILTDGALRAISDEAPDDQGNPGTPFAVKYAGKDATEAHITSTNNPHSVTKAQVGLGNVDNTSDVNKPISTATQTALNLKQDTANMIGTLEGDLTGKYPSASLLQESIQTATANFKGVFDTWDDVPTVWPTSETNPEPTKNDYMVVLADESHEHLGQTWRYKYDVIIPSNEGYDKTKWKAEYPINTTTFTPEEWAAIRSGITAALVATYNGYASQISGKVDKTTTVNGHALSANVTVTKSDVGLGSVANTGDSATPVSGGTTKFTTGGAYIELAKKQNKVLSGTVEPTDDIGEDGDIYILYSE